MEACMPSSRDIVVIINIVYGDRTIEKYTRRDEKEI